MKYFLQFLSDWIRNNSLGATNYLDRLDECEQEDPDADTSPEQLDKSGSPKETKEPHIDQLSCVHDATNHRDEIEGVPGVLQSAKIVSICNSNRYMKIECKTMMMKLTLKYAFGPKDESFITHSIVNNIVNTKLQSDKTSMYSMGAPWY